MTPSIRLGAGPSLQQSGADPRARGKPDAVLIYKPHRCRGRAAAGVIADQDLARLADHTARACDPVALLDQVDAVWTITSTLGFEALLRGIPVTTLGALCRLGADARPWAGARAAAGAAGSLDALTHAVLIAYPAMSIRSADCPARPSWRWSGWRGLLSIRAARCGSWPRRAGGAGRVCLDLAARAAGGASSAGAGPGQAGRRAAG